MGKPNLPIIFVDPQRKPVPMRWKTLGNVDTNQRALNVVVDPTLHRARSLWSIADENRHRHKTDTHHLGQEACRYLPPSEGARWEIVETTFACCRLIHPQPKVGITHQQRTVTGTRRGLLNVPWSSRPGRTWQIPGIRHAHHTRGLR